ncbi:MAG: hypothetical protein KUA43_13390 [Hoeflea sp.]|uniref:hypothetical protein n=1 Tax=Hoeflea sp. TaxID=1940281 RepID=UPI001DF1B9CB|nr:hypothetical protein [Hoeflea sp.]MBU4531153.1 hypothetical protein [Alphaproteobacteria bacterium]MBU4545785.1 hypothetical protein [Alphaproteobacteria bacterium]MBU4550754.1 hypothetical protein [Alphaproteobacteria bacterium]MBV1724430.1 hypothetical protein [Hoeflea sp.]MBV1760450.1 hypothetical protein [Hoeflea sp.]
MSRHALVKGSKALPIFWIVADCSALSDLIEGEKDVVTCASFAQVASGKDLVIDDNDVTRNRAMIVLGIGAIAIATATLASFSLLLRSNEMRVRQNPVF